MQVISIYLEKNITSRDPPLALFFLDFFFCPTSTPFFVSEKANKRKKKKNIKKQKKKKNQPSPPPSAPGIRPKVITVSDHLQRRTEPVGSHVADIIAPPAEIDTRIVKAKEDKEGRDSQSGIQSSREQVIILGPPGAIPALEPVLKGQAEKGPGHVVAGGGGGDGRGGRHDDGDVHVAHPRVGVAASGGVDDDGEEGADEEEVEHGVVKGAVGEELLRADETPEDDGGAVGGGEWAVELGLGKG